MDASLVKLFEELKIAFEGTPCDLQKCKQLVDQLKLKLIHFAFLSPEQVAERLKEALLAREMLELATLLSVRLQDIAYFEKNFAQLKPYYFDFAGKLPQSQRQWMILGLNLLKLLSQNDLARFHTELELIPLSAHDSLYIKQPLQLQQYITEGSFTRVWDARADVPHESYLFFMDRLMEAVRKHVATTVEKAYHSLSLPYAQKVLLFSSQDALLQFCRTQAGWQVKGDQVLFPHAPDSRDLIAPTDLIKQTIGYAREAERIV